MSKAVIFDLDNCLSAADEVGQELFAPAFDAIRKANKGRLSDEELDRAFADCWRHALDWVAEKHGFSREMLTAGWAALSTTEVHQPMRGYPDLPVLRQLPVQKFLVTSGFQRLQQSKIDALHFADQFVEIVVDAIDQPGRQGKRAIFESILARHHFEPKDVLVVGDNAESEIAAGNQLGMATVQILRPGVPFAPKASHHIKTLDELKPLLGVA